MKVNHIQNLCFPSLYLKLQSSLNQESNNLIGNYQYGFGSKHSCLAQLLRYHDHTLTHLNSGDNVDLIESNHAGK